MDESQEYRWRNTLLGSAHRDYHLTDVLGLRLCRWHHPFAPEQRLLLDISSLMMSVARLFAGESSTRSIQDILAQLKKETQRTHACPSPNSNHSHHRMPLGFPRNYLQISLDIILILSHSSNINLTPQTPCQERIKKPKVYITPFDIVS